MIEASCHCGAVHLDNARLMDPGVSAGARVRHLDGAVTERYIDE